jgi:hypothetical protein
MRWRFVYHAKDSMIQAMKVDMQQAIDSMVTGFAEHLHEVMCTELTNNIALKLPSSLSKDSIETLAREHTNLWLGLETQRDELREADALLSPLKPSVRVLGQQTFF